MMTRVCIVAGVEIDGGLMHTIEMITILCLGQGRTDGKGSMKTVSEETVDSLIDFSNHRFPESVEE